MKNNSIHSKENLFNWYICIFNVFLFFLKRKEFVIKNQKSGFQEFNGVADI